MVKKFTWDKINKTRLMNDKGIYNYNDEANHNKNLDNYWKKKFKGKYGSFYKDFFEQWDKESKKFK